MTFKKELLSFDRAGNDLFMQQFLIPLHDKVAERWKTQQHKIASSLSQCTRVLTICLGFNKQDWTLAKSLTA